jgi:WhiB family transcriptional regulator, redox-sensing transcriptional regulator
MDRSSNAESVAPVAFHGTSWESSAACRGSESVWFVPPLGRESKHERRAREATAKRICADCPVSRECLDYALRVNEPFGIWGGLTEAERRQLGNIA